MGAPLMVTRSRQRTRNAHWRVSLATPEKRQRVASRRQPGCALSFPYVREDEQNTRLQDELPARC